jgi:hypothetical protein
MNLKKLEPEDFENFQIEINKSRSPIERTLNFTWFYVTARFRTEERDFKEKNSVDGSNDGGIDFFFKEGNTFYLIQSKYHERSTKESLETITRELQKIEKTIIGTNTNRPAADFINSLGRELNSEKCYLEIIWLTTNEVPENVRVQSQKNLDAIFNKHNWRMNADINFIDRYAIEGVIYDIKHGYVPHTGKKELHYEAGECMTINKDRGGIEAIVCNAKAIEILDWFDNSYEIQKYLQKNVRESVGENLINRALRSSFNNDPGLFWYKHNGIIIFGDWLEVDHVSMRVTIRNPQIVNGAQTISQLFKVYNSNRGMNNPAKLLVRFYRLPYEDSETYKRSIDIIAALNSQNKIKASDLHSTDPRQVVLENRVMSLGRNYSYNRKRSELAKSVSRWNIFMTRLAHIFYSCHYSKPDEGVAGKVESFFGEEKKYEDSFPENLIKKTLTQKPDHIVFNYIDSWQIFYAIDRNLASMLRPNFQDVFSYVRWYISADIYQQLQRWKEQVYSGSWRDWLDFIESNEFIDGVLRYAKKRYSVYYGLIPKKEMDARNFFKSLEGRKKFTKNPGSYSAFKAEIAKVYKRFLTRTSR